MSVSAQSSKCESWSFLEKRVGTKARIELGLPTGLGRWERGSRSPFSIRTHTHASPLRLRRGHVGMPLFNQRLSLPVSAHLPCLQRDERSTVRGSAARLPQVLRGGRVDAGSIEERERARARRGEDSCSADEPTPCLGRSRARSRASSRAFGRRTTDKNSRRAGRLRA